jgi:hypothetical protein
VKRRFRLGPATTLAIAGAIVVAYVRFPGWQREAEEARQLEVTRARIAAKPREKALPARTLQTLWSERVALHLSPSQLQKVERLRLEEARQTAPLQRSAELAARNFEAWMKTHQTGAALSDIQQQGAIYSAASAPLSLERERFWNRALAVLSPAQRAQIEAKTHQSYAVENLS